MAPSIVLAKETALGIEGPDSAELYEGYDAYKTDNFALLGKGELKAFLTSDAEQITWNAETQQIEVAEGLQAGTYKAVLKLENENGETVEHTFTVTVAENAVTGISVSAPTRTAYTVGDALDLTGMKVIKAYNLRGANFKKLERAFHNFMKESIKLEGVSGPFYLIAVAFLQIGLSMITMVGTYLLLGGTLKLPMLIIFLLVGSRVFDPLVSAIT